MEGPAGNDSIIPLRTSRACCICAVGAPGDGCTETIFCGPSWNRRRWRIRRTVEWGLLSVFCLGDRAEGIYEEGVQYPLKDAVLTPEFPLGVSNHILEPVARVAVGRGALAVGWELEPLSGK